MNKEFNVGVGIPLKETIKTWDDKFGLIEVADIQSDKIDTNIAEANARNNFIDEDRKKIDGVGADAEIITNAVGGKQSKSPMAMHLVDPEFLSSTFGVLTEDLEYLDEGDITCVADENMFIHGCYRAISSIAQYMKTGFESNLETAMEAIEYEGLQQTIRIAKVLQYGAERYEPNNWRLIPEEEHINHALIHLVAAAAGDTQDDHIDHALCRLMMAYATEKSENFNYNLYIKKNS